MDRISYKIGHHVDLIKNIKLFYSSYLNTPSTCSQPAILLFTNPKKLVLLTRWSLPVRFKNVIPKTRLAKNDMVTYDDWAALFPPFLPKISDELIDRSTKGLEVLLQMIRKFTSVLGHKLSYSY